MKNLGYVNDFYPETKDLLSMLQAAGIAIIWGENGGEDTFKFDRTMPFARELTACDSASFVVLCPDGKRRGVMLVMGNCPGELAADYHTGCPVLESVIEKHSAKWEKRKQPTRFCQSTFDRETFNARAASYSRHYAACQAGGMSSDASHEYARELSLREFPEVSPVQFVIALPDGGGYVEQVTPEAFRVRPDVSQASRFNSRADAMNYAAGVGLSSVNVCEVQS